MALPALPATVPFCPVAGTWAIAEPYRANLESTMNAGSRRMRRQFTATIATVQGTVLMKSSEFAIFRAFVRDTLFNGSLRFMAPIFDGVAYVNRECLLRNAGRYGAVTYVGGAVRQIPIEMDVWGL